MFSSTSGPACVCQEPLPRACLVFSGSWPSTAPTTWGSAASLCRAPIKKAWCFRYVCLILFDAFEEVIFTTPHFSLYEYVVLVVVVAATVVITSVIIQNSLIVSQGPVAPAGSLLTQIHISSSFTLINNQQVQMKRYQTQQSLKLKQYVQKAKVHSCTFQSFLYSISKRINGCNKQLFF